MAERGRRPGPDKFDKYRVNEQIRTQNVRLVGEGDEAQVIATSDALAMARGKELDLVEVSPNQDPPIVKIIDFSKFRFEQIKKAKEAKKKQKTIHIKEIKMRPNIDTHDFEHKVKHAISFFDKGDKVKFTLMFRGRELAHTNLGFDVMRKIQAALDEVAQVEKTPSQEGRNITMIMSGRALVVKKPQE